MINLSPCTCCSRIYVLLLLLYNLQPRWIDDLWAAGERLERWRRRSAAFIKIFILGKLSLERSSSSTYCCWKYMALWHNLIINTNLSIRYSVDGLILGSIVGSLLAAHYNSTTQCQEPSASNYIDTCSSGLWEPSEDFARPRHYRQQTVGWARGDFPGESKSQAKPRKTRAQGAISNALAPVRCLP